MIQKEKLFDIVRMFKRTLWGFRYEILLLLVAGFVSSFLEGIGINAVIPLFSFVVKGQGQPTDVISKAIEQFFFLLHVPYTLRFLLIFIGVLFVFKALMAFTSVYVTDNIRSKSIRNTRSRLLKLTLGANWPYLSKQKIGYIEKIIMNDVQSTYSAVFSYSSALFIQATNVLIYIVIAFNISPIITGITIVLGIIFFWGFKPLMYRVRQTSHEIALAQKEVANHINESMIGMKTIKAMALEDRVVEKGISFFERFRRLDMRQCIISALAYVSTQPLSVLVISALFAFSYKSTNFSFVSFLVIVYAINRLFTYVQSIQGLIQNIYMQYPYMKSIVEYEDRAGTETEKIYGKSLINFSDKIEFKNVNFSYKTGHKNRVVLSDISFSLPKGQMIGLVGPSGGGKTTIVDSILGLIKPDGGEILVDGQNLNDINSRIWKKSIGYVSQDIFLMNDTIRNNITFYDPTISEADIIDAAKKAHIYEMIEDKPQGLDTSVGERGMELSGGQRQRIALARVLARKVDILILDEATSALDNESETIIKRALEELRGRVTIIAIAHRPTTVDNADKLIIIKDGRLAEEGKPADLLRDENSYFHKVYYSKP